MRTYTKAKHLHKPGRKMICTREHFYPTPSIPIKYPPSGHSVVRGQKYCMRNNHTNIQQRAIGQTNLSTTCRDDYSTRCYAAPCASGVGVNSGTFAGPVGAVARQKASKSPSRRRSCGCFFSCKISTTLNKIGRIRGCRGFRSGSINAGYHRRLLD